jgi:hypothetical protein
MGDTPTKIADVIVPELFNPYMRSQSIIYNQFFESGIVENVPDLNFGSRGGLSIEMPFWKQLGERAQLLDDDYDLEIKKIKSGQDTAVQHARALVYGATDLAATLAGDDPMKAIGDGIAGNWSSEFNHVLLASLAGAMSATGIQTNVHDVSALSGAAAVMDGASFIDAGQKLGDHKENISGVAMHSAVEASLAKNDLIETVRDSEGKVVMKTFMTKRIIIDDSMTGTSGGVYSSYLFGGGAIGWGEGSPKVPSETDRNPLINGGQEFLVSRRHFVLHPRGIRWTPQSGVPAKMTPSDAELADPDNWSLVYEPKNIRIVKFVHKII